MKKSHSKKKIPTKIAALTMAAGMVITMLPQGGGMVKTAKAASAPYGTKAFSLDEVQITDGYYLAAQESDIEFLCNFDPDRMLSRFRETAGLDTMGSKPYSGWEDSYIGGHCVGHYLSAAAQAVQATGDPTLNDILTYMIDELQVCQDALGTGFILGAKLEDRNYVEKQFDWVEGKVNTPNHWVPWYNMHKVLTGLIDVYKYTGNEKALDVAKNLGTWIYNRVSKWNTSTQTRVLGEEYGGMNDCLYELYRLTDDTNYRDAAHMFDEPNLYKTVTSGKDDTLNGRHANATIPKFLGALNRYKVLSEKGELTAEDEEYLTYVEDFWTLVTSKHSFATGGLSDMEHFRKDNALDATRTQCNAESCCAHNMLRMSRDLFMITGDVKYADYYETTLRNAIMGSINTDDGSTTYFTPMATGYFKFFSQSDPAKNMFWCCTGTGMENFTKLGDSIYFHNDDSIIVNQYVASVLNWKEKGITLTQDSDVTKSDEAAFTVSSANGPINLHIYLRVPEWISGPAYVTINDESVTGLVTEGGYIDLDRTWSTGDVIKIKYPMTVQAIGLPDNDTVYAFRYGPTLLAAKLGTERMDLNNGDNLTWAGANLSAAHYKVVGSEEWATGIAYGSTNISILGSETLYIDDATLDSYIQNIADNMERTSSDTLEFKLNGTDASDNFDDGLTFVPFNTLNDERYGIYWYFSAQTQEELEATIMKNKEELRIANCRVDSIQPGYGQYEQDSIHAIEESNSVSGTIEQGGSTRYASAGGYFSYNMKVNPERNNSVLCRFAKEDNGKTIKITVGDTVIATDTLNYSGTEDFYDVYYKIPEDVLQKSVTDLQVTNDSGIQETFTVIKVKFESNDSNDSARLVGGLYTTVDFSTNASITQITPNIGNIEQNGDVFTLNVPIGTQVVKANIKLADIAGLLYINDLLVNDGKMQTFTVNGEDVSFKLTAYAEDHTTSKNYTLNIKQTAPEIQPDSAEQPSNHEQHTTPPAADTGVNNTGSDTASAPASAANKKSVKIKGKKTVKVGKSIKLTAKLKGVKGKVKWSVNKKKLAKLTNAKKNTVKLKALKAGKVKVTAKVKKIKKTVTIKIKK